MALYTKDLKHKMTLRLNDDLKAFVEEMADLYTISPSDYIRQCIATQLDARKMTKKLFNQLGDKAVDIVEERKQLELNKEGLENGTDRKTDINYKLQ